MRQDWVLDSFMWSENKSVPQRLVVRKESHLLMPRQPLQDRGSASYAYTNIASLRQYDMSPSPTMRGQRPVEMGVIMQSRGHLLLLPPIPIVCIAPIQIFFNIQFLFSFSSYCPDITDNGLCLAAVRDLFLRINVLWWNRFETVSTS